MRTSLANMNVLVVEDEALVAMMVENWLASFGVSEVNVCCDLGSALAASSEQRPDLALVDINLGGVKSYPLIERLWEMKVPVLLATGYSAADLEPPFSEASRVQKPLSRAALQSAISGLMAETEGRA